MNAYSLLFVTFYLLLSNKYQTLKFLQLIKYIILIWNNGSDFF
jgi:hypothetical protein